MLVVLLKILLSFDHSDIIIPAYSMLRGTGAASGWVLETGGHASQTDPSYQNQTVHIIMVLLHVGTANLPQSSFPSKDLLLIFLTINMTFISDSHGIVCFVSPLIIGFFQYTQRYSAGKRHNILEPGVFLTLSLYIKDTEMFSLKCYLF